MVHIFFKTVAACPELVDDILSKKENKNGGKVLKFSQVFSTFFPQDGYRDEDNIASWLEAICTDFKFEGYQTIVNWYTIAKVEVLFKELNLQPHEENNTHVFQWWLAMTHAYWKLMGANYDRNDQIFGFMTGFPISRTRVIILGNRPTDKQSSTGFAFHGVHCKSTKAMLNFTKFELQMARDIMGEDLFCCDAYDRKWANAIENCSLKGWIEQGVLLMNAQLTHHKAEKICAAWQIFTDFFVKYLSNRANNLVFLLLGEVAWPKQQIINEKHMVISLYHPAYYSCSREIKQELDWRTIMPLLRTNFYLYNAGLAPIKWGNLKGYSQDHNEGNFTRISIPI